MAFLGLHGFTQRGTAWSEVAAVVGGDWHLPDLPGHGTEPAVPWEAAVARIAGFLTALPPARVLAGYSMGGRLALATAVAAPDLVDRLILVSAAPGIDDAAERHRRQIADEMLANRIEVIGLEAFLDEWAERPMFAGLRGRDPSWLAADRDRRLGNTASGLAAALRLLGRGVQPFAGEHLSGLAIPVLLVVGEQDPSYQASARDLERQLPLSRVVVIPGAGHALLGERPEAVAAAIADWVR
jgi:2-succinyl-6-hydroxy-2,4-cyclohexadiene-1-carboxylate synthase